jgi:predicted Holliday junction resolvase-like endonuclease
MSTTTWVLLVLWVLLFALVVSLALAVRYYKGAARAAEEELQRERSKPVASPQGTGAQRATIKGQLAEQIAPLLPGFPFHPSDFRFLGQPIDFVVFVGLTEAKEGLGDIQEVVIGDIKQGNARLSPHQRAIKRAVDDGRVRWETIHISPDFAIKGRQQ